MFRRITTLCRTVNFSSKFQSSVPIPILKNSFNSPIIAQSYCTNSDIFDSINRDELTGGDEMLSKKLKLIMLEIDVMRQEGQLVPSKMTTERWKDLLKLDTRSQRLKQLRFWFLNEMKKANDKAKKLKKQEERFARLEALRETKSDHIEYGLGGSNILLRVYDTTIDRWKNSRLIEAIMFGQPIVIDCSYDQYMSLKESANAALQLSYVFAENRSHKSPYNLYFCNANTDGNTLSKLNKLIPTLYNDDFPVNVTKDSYLDIFPKNKLVYLTPHCRDMLTTYNHDDVYIIGAMVDKANCEPLSLAKAKAEGLRMAQLPIDRYLNWSVGTKSLTINQVLCIMLDMKITNDWNFALRHVPQRKLKDNNETDPKSKRMINIRKLYG